MNVEEAFDLIGVMSAMVFLMTLGSIASAIALSVCICRAMWIADLF